MQLIDYPLTHPYPKKPLFEVLTILLIVIVLPILVLINIVTSGYELVPALRSTMNPDDSFPGWWHVQSLPPLLRPDPPPCDPRDFGRGDVIRLSPSLFEYKVLGAWQNETSKTESRVQYNGTSFKNCSIYASRFDYSRMDLTQTITTGIYCPDSPNAFMETSVTFADALSKDFVGQYYGYAIDVFSVINPYSRDYRKAVFAVLDIISTDSLSIIGGGHPSSLPILSLSTSFDEKYRSFNDTEIVYGDGNMEQPDGLGPASVYRDTIRNLVNAVAQAVYLDLGSKEPNIFLNQSVVGDTFVPNLAPSGVNPTNWSSGSSSFYYGYTEPPYQTWAEMLIAGLPKNITLENLENLPDDSLMVSNYLCPVYRRKSMSSFLSSVFIGTATMFLSVWGAWVFGSAILARRWSGPCSQCAFDGKECMLHPRQKDSTAESGDAGNVVVLPSIAHDRQESDSNLSKIG
ncbi:hypothetical protein FRC07_007612 [Ceratobasidium sp. 392]|nr:hypothetical protein FRC07_007612 [Ceratobasidium sp. 392]